MDKRPPKVSSVYLTIDSKMQFVVEDALDDAMKRTNAAGAAVIIMDPETGAILAMEVGLPLIPTTTAGSPEKLA